MNPFNKGDKVRFEPKVIEDYSLDGVRPGAEGVVLNAAYDDEVLVSLARQDGSICEKFIAFTEDLEKIDES